MGIHGVVQAYHQALNTVQLYGPTNVAPIINHVANFAEKAAQPPNAQVGWAEWNVSMYALLCLVPLMLPLLAYSQCVGVYWPVA